MWPIKCLLLIVWPLTSPQDIEVGANPVQIEVGEFDEAIEIVEDTVAESKFTHANLFSVHKIIFYFQQKTQNILHLILSLTP